MKILDFFKREIEANREYYAAQREQEKAKPKHASSRFSAAEYLKPWFDSVKYAPAPLSAEEYSEMREQQVKWLESRYDFNSIKGVSSILVSANLPRPPFGGVTGDVDYYLRRKGFAHEDAGNIDLAILCMEKSNAIRMLAGSGYKKDDYYALVKMLARNGRIEEAQNSKRKIDLFFGDAQNDGLIGIGKKMVSIVQENAREIGTDLVIMSVHGNTCSECAKYQGRVFSLGGSNSRFPRIPAPFFSLGGIHKGCSHTFSPYIHGVNDPALEYALSIQQISGGRYTRDIVAFSNRPFVDDRPPELIEQAMQIQKEREAKEEKRRYYESHMIEIEAERGRNQETYLQLRKVLPDVCPKSFSGFMRMKGQNTKNFQKLKELATDKGIAL